MGGAQYRGGVQYRGDIMSTVGDILSTVGVFSTVGDIMINVGTSWLRRHHKKNGFYFKQYIYELSSGLLCGRQQLLFKSEYETNSHKLKSV